MAGSSSSSPSSYFQYRSPFGDTTLTKVFVGGLAWETPTEKMREYFEQFGEILEAVIITDKNTGKSKGYGFVTFRDPEAAKRAVADPNPMIDGRRANCNIAAAGRPRELSPPRGRRQGQSGQIYYPGAQCGSSYNAVQGSITAPPQVPQSLPLMYPSYGYAAYNPQYGYNQAAALAMYNQQLQQQAQYYQQMYGSGGSASSTSPTTMQPPHHLPYYFAYSMQAAAAAAAASRAAAPAGGLSLPYPTIQRSLGPYFYYSSPASSLNQSPTTAGPHHLQQHQEEEPSAASSDSSRHQPLPSQIESLESSQVSSPETEAKVVPTGSPPPSD